MTAPRDLPPQLRRAWGDRAPAVRRGPRASLTVDGILDAAVTIADADGVAGISLVRVAERLGVTPNALYRYLDSREELELLLRERALAHPPRLDLGGGWRAAAADWARRVRERYRAHPWLADLRVAVPITPNALGWLEALLRALSTSGLDEASTLRAAAQLDGYVRSQFLTQRDLARWGGTGDAPLADLVAPLLAERDLDLVSALFRAGTYREPTARSLDADFEFGLDVLLGGLERMARG